MDQLCADLFQRHEPHVNDERLSWIREFGPGKIDHALLQMARDEADRLGVIAVRERNARIGRTAVGCGNAGHDPEGNALLGEGCDLFAPSPEGERIAALQAQCPLAVLRFLREQRIDAVLGHGMLTRRLPT